MTDEQLTLVRILVASMMVATMCAARGDYAMTEEAALKWADDLITAARESSPPAAKAPDPLNDGRWCVCCGQVQTPHAASPDCQCVDCLKRDARRFRKFGASKDALVWIDAKLAAEDAKEQAK